MKKNKKLIIVLSLSVFVTLLVFLSGNIEKKAKTVEDVNENEVIAKEVLASDEDEEKGNAETDDNVTYEISRETGWSGLGKNGFSNINGYGVTSFVATKTNADGTKSSQPAFCLDGGGADPGAAYAGEIATSYKSETILKGAGYGHTAALMTWLASKNITSETDRTGYGLALRALTFAKLSSGGKTIDDGLGYQKCDDLKRLPEGTQKYHSYDTCAYFQAIGNCMTSNSTGPAINECLQKKGNLTIPDNYMNYILEVKEYYINNSQPATGDDILPGDVKMTYKTIPGKKTKVECDGDNCTATKTSTITYKVDDKEVNLNDKSTIKCEAQVKATGLTTDCKVEGNQVVVTISFSKKNWKSVASVINGSDKDFKVRVDLDNVTTAKILTADTSNGNVKFQRMLIIDTSKKGGTFYVDFKLDDLGCDNIIKDAGADNITKMDDAGDTAGIKALFEPDYVLGPDPTAENSCCEQIKDIATNTYNEECSGPINSCEEFFEKVTGKGTEGKEYEGCLKSSNKSSDRKGIEANIVTAFWEVHKSNNDCPSGQNNRTTNKNNFAYFGTKEDYFNTNLMKTMESKGFTFGADRAKATGKQDCCDLLESRLLKSDGTFANDQYEEFYETMCGNPSCALIVRRARKEDKNNPTEFSDLKKALDNTFGTLPGDTEKIKAGFDETKKWLEEKYKTTSIGKDDKNSYTLGKSKDGKAEDCCETFSHAGYWNIGVFCKSSCMIALEDKDIKSAVNSIKIANPDSFEAAKIKLEEGPKNVESDTKYTFGKKEGFEDCCETAINTAKGNKEDIRAYCNGSCKIELKKDEVAAAVKAVKKDDEASFKNAVSALQNASSGKFTFDGSGSDTDCCEVGISINSVLKEYCKDKEKTCDNAIKSINKEIKNGTKIDAGLIQKYILSPLYLSRNNKEDKNNCCSKLAAVPGAKETDFYKTKCEKPDDIEQKDRDLECEKIGFHLQCDPQVYGKTEIYSVWEGLDWGNKDKDKISECIVTVDGDPSRKEYATYSGSALNKDEIAKAEELHDAAQSKNQYTIADSVGNQYCRINCYERWDYQFATFQNFTGRERAIKAGSYFAMNKDLYIKGSRTCVTTYLDYQAYYTAVRQLSNKIAAAWNTLMDYTDAFNYAVDKNDKFTMENLDDNPHYANEDIPKTLKYYDTVPCGTEENPKECEVYVVDEYGKCPQYNIHVNTYEELGKLGLANAGDLVNLLNDEPADDEGYGKNDKATSTKAKMLGWATLSSQRVAAQPFSCEVGHCPEHTASLPEIEDAYTWKCEWTRKKWKNYRDAWEDMIGRVEYHTYSEEYTQSKGYLSKHGFEDGEGYDVGTNLVKGIEKAYNDLITFNKDLQAKTRDMAYCQNFFLSNDEEAQRKVKDDTVDNYNYGKTENNANVNIYKDDSNYIYNGKNKTLTEIADYNPLTPANNTKISTTYNPVATYKYDEYDYMTQIGEYNQIIDNIKRNQEVYGSSSRAFNTKNKATSSETDQMIYINKIDTLAYDLKDEDPWEDKSQKGHDYGKTSGKLVDGLCDENASGDCIGIKKESSARKEVDKFMTICYAGKGYNEGSLPEFTNPDKQAIIKINNTDTNCDTSVTFRYYKVNYLSQTITNSSYFVNYGNFYYRGSYEDVQFGKDLNDAISKSKVNKTEDEELKWSVLASQNVFPINSTTRRGIYSYVYDFSNMGNYNTNKKDDLGRVIGHGAEGRSIVYGPEKVSSAFNQTGNGERWCQYEVYESMCACCGYPIGTLINLYHGDDDITIKQYETFKTPTSSEQVSTGNNTNGGEMLYYPSTVSLYDLEAIGNWGDKTNITYEGENYETVNDKGAQLANAIKSVGENIYDIQPEYSFELTPKVLQTIIDDNTKKGESYIVTYENLKVEGPARYISGAEDPNVSPRFVHYSSKFLNSEVPGKNNGILAGRSYDNSCYVSSYDEGALKSFASGGSYGTCKWLDFCGTANAYDSATVPQTINYCLAFK